MFSLLVEELPTDLKETCAEKEDGAEGKAVQMLEYASNTSSYREKNQEVHSSRYNSSYSIN